MATTKPTKATAKKSSSSGRRTGYAFLRLTEAEEAAVREVSPFDPLATSIRRLCLERVAEIRGAMPWATARKKPAKARAPKK